MAQGTQRLRYFDGQFLRSGDFTDEQSYHVAARRQLNLEMGLTGIVSGAAVQIDQNSVPPAPPQRTGELAASGAASTSAAGVEFLSLGTGYVIDQLGREIHISAPTSLTPLLARAGLKVGPNELWIVYTETASGSPAPGYQLCNELSQNTRWTESFDLILRPLTVAPDPNAPDPNRDLMGICLGIMMVTSGGAGPAFLLPPHWWHRRRYAGIRAQRIIAPDTAESDAYTFYGAPPAPQAYPPPPHGYVHIKTPNGVYSDGNMLVQNNMLIGDDFVLDPTQNAATGSNLPTSTPLPLPGNLKVAGDCFLQGQLYSTFGNSGGPWLGLQAYIATLVPDVQCPTTLVHFDLSAGTPQPSQTVQISTTLPAFSKVDVQASIAAFQFASQTDANTFLSSPASPGIYPSLSVSGQFSGKASPNQANVTVTINVGGPFGATPAILFKSVDVALIAVFRP